MHEHPRGRELADIYILHNEGIAPAVLVVSLLLTALAWYITDRHVDRSAHEQFLFAAENAGEHIHRRLLDYEQVLRGAVALFDALEHPATRRQWQRYVAGLGAQSFLPGIRGIGYTPMVPAGELSAHIAAVQAEGFPDYRVQPAGERELYGAVLYLEPFDQPGPHAFGYDMFADPACRFAMEQARDGARPALSQRVNLAQAAGQEAQIGFLLYLPVYRPGLPTATVAQRRAALTGFVYSPLRVEELMRDILVGNDPAVALALFDGDGPPTAATLLYDSDPGSDYAGAAYRLTKPLALPGRTWAARFHSRPAFEQATRSSQPALVALGGLTMSLLLFSITRSLAGERRRVRAKAEAMTAELREANHRLERELAEREQTAAALRESQLRYSSLFEAGADAVYVHDVLPDGMPGRILEANEQASRYSGYSRAELLTMTPLQLDAPDSGVDLDPVVAQLLAGGSVTFEQVHQCKDGRRVPVEVHADLFTLDGRRAVIAVVRDITERRRAQEELRRLNEGLEQRVREAVDKSMEQERLLIQQSRLAAMGEMIGNIAHQWRQPINALGLLLANIKDAFEFGELTPQYLATEVEKGSHLIHKMSTTIDDFRNFFRPDKERRPFALSPVIEDTLQLVGPSLKDHAIAVRVEGDPSVRATGYPNELAQVLVNLLTNAKEALLERKVDHGLIVVVLGQDETSVWLSVADNAGGIAEPVLTKVFDPYFTTKAKGTGIGLYMSRMIVGHMGGTLSACNRDGGARFTIHLPAAAQVEAHAQR